MAQNQTPFYVAALQIGSTIYPIRPNASLVCPKNWNVPAVVGNYWAFNYGDGLRMPVLDCSIYVFDSATSIFSLANLQSFITRSADANHDTPTISGDITLYDGRSTVTMTGAKLESFVISSSVGEDIVFNCRFVGSGLTVNNAPTTPYVGGGTVIPGWYNATPPTKLLRFNALSFTNPSGCTVWGFTLGFQHNHTPNLCLNGTQFPSDVNAGMMGASLSLTTQNTVSPTSVVADGGAVAFTVTGSTLGTRTFSIQNVLNNNPDDRVISAPRLMRTYNFVCLGVQGFGAINSSPYAAPIKIT